MLYLGIALFIVSFLLILSLKKIGELDTALETARMDARKAYYQANCDIQAARNEFNTQKHKADLVVEDAKQRMEEFKKQPMVAAMTDNQVSVLAEMLAVHIRDIFEAKKELVN